MARAPINIGTITTRLLGRGYLHIYCLCPNLVSLTILMIQYISGYKKCGKPKLNLGEYMWDNFSLLFSPSHSHSISDLDFNAEKEKEGTFWCFTVKHDGPTSVAGNLIIASHNRCKKTGVIAPVCLFVESWDFPRASHRATQNILQPHWQKGTQLVIIIILQCLWNICFSPPIYGHLGKS